MARRSIIRGVLAAAAVCAACRGDAGEPRWRGSVVREGAAPEVRNPERPVFGDGTVPVRTLWAAPAASEDGAGLGWSQPTRLALAPDAVYVLDPTARAVHVVSHAGRPLRRVGREGDGPGELRSPFGVAFVDGLLAVGDAGGTVDLFSPAGEPAGNLRLGTVATSMVGVEPRGLLVKNFRGEQRMYDVRGGEPGSPLAGFARRREGAEFACSRVSAAGPNLVRLDCATPVFQVLARDGAVLRTVRVDRGPVAATAEELDVYRQSLMREAALAGSAGSDPARLIDGLLSDQSPKRIMRAIRYDTASALYAVWEQQPQEFGNGPARLHLFSHAGVFLATAVFPDAWVDFAFDGLRVYALAEDPETGVVRLAAYEVTLPPDVERLARADEADGS